LVFPKETGAVEGCDVLTVLVPVGAELVNKELHAGP